MNMVVFDAAFLLMLLDPKIKSPDDALTQKKIDDFKVRVDFLISNLQKKRQKILVPTPALSEVLVRADKARSEYVRELQKAAEFRVEPFCVMAAIEVALMTKRAMDDGDKKDGSTDIWSKVKYDRQIVAVARVHKVSTIYTNDKNLINFSRKVGINPVSIGDLPLPPEEAQAKLL